MKRFKWHLRELVHAQDGFTWWDTIKSFTTQKEAEKYKQLYHRHRVGVEIQRDLR